MPLSKGKPEPMRYDTAKALRLTALSIPLAALSIPLAALSIPFLLFFSLGLPAYLVAQTPDIHDIGEGGNSKHFDMAPETNLTVVTAAVKEIPVPMAIGPVQPDWDSLRQNYQVPAWFRGAKFGIFIHFGIFSVPAHGSEWYEKFLYAGGHDDVLDEINVHESFLDWHTEHYGPPERFGYKDFIPMFHAEHFDADAWALLFKKAGARYVVPGAQHHENFAMWDSQVTPFNAVKMGPKRDIVGELAIAIRKQGMKLGLANHGIENFQFVNPPQVMIDRMKATKADLYDPQWFDFYNVSDRSDAACRRFLVNWYERNVELIDKYQPDLMYFDNGIDMRYLDPLKLTLAAYYYNRAAKWGKQVSLTTKKAAFAPSDSNTHTIGSILDFEAYTPGGIRTGSWEVDRPIGETSWGYTTGMKINSAETVIGWLVDAVSKNGTLLLNVSPMADGTIPPDQQATLLGVGKWLETNGEAIYDSHSWTRFVEPGKLPIYFTVKGDTLYAILLGTPPSRDVSIASLALQAEAGKVTSIRLLGSPQPLAFIQDRNGLKVTLPNFLPSESAYVLRIEGLQMNAPTWTLSGNPMPKNGVAMQ